MLTLAEQERRAYMSGSTELAAALTLAADAEDNAEAERDELDDLQKTLDRVEVELHDARDRLRDAEAERDELQSRIDEMLDIA